MYKDHMLLFVYLIDFVMIKITSEKVVRNDQQTDVFTIRRGSVCVCVCFCLCLSTYKPRIIRSVFEYVFFFGMKNCRSRNNQLNQ